MDKEENCLPEVVEKEDENHSPNIACSHCSQTDCCYWILYNSDKACLDEEDN